MPSFFFAAVEYHRGSDETPEEVFREFSGGFATESGDPVIDLRSQTKDTVGDTTFICVSVVGNPSGTICMWTDRDIVGLVGAYGQNIDTAHDLTMTVRTAVET